MSNGGTNGLTPEQWAMVVNDFRLWVEANRDEILLMRSGTAQEVASSTANFLQSFLTQVQTMLRKIG